MDRELLDRRAAIERERERATGGRRHGRRGHPRLVGPLHVDLLDDRARPVPRSTRPTRSPTAGTRRRSAGPPRTSSTSSPRPGATPGCWRSSPTPPGRCCGSRAARAARGRPKGVGLVPGRALGRDGRRHQRDRHGARHRSPGGRVRHASTGAAGPRLGVLLGAGRTPGRLGGRRHRPEHDVGPGQPARPAHGRRARPPDRGRAGASGEHRRRGRAGSTCARSGAAAVRRSTACRVALSPRQLELVVALAIVGTATLDELHALLFGDRPVSRTTLRAEISHTRDLLGGAIASRPYRLTVPVPRSTPSTCSTASGPATSTGAVERYDGPLLPASDAPLIVERRYHLDVALRTALLRDGSTAQLLRFAGVHPSDVEVLQRAVAVAGPDDPDLPAAVAALAVATADLASDSAVANRRVRDGVLRAGRRSTDEHDVDRRTRARAQCDSRRVGGHPGRARWRRLRSRPGRDRDARRAAIDRDVLLLAARPGAGRLVRRVVLRRVGPRVRLGRVEGALGRAARAVRRRARAGRADARGDDAPPRRVRLRPLAGRRVGRAVRHQRVQLRHARPVPAPRRPTSPWRPSPPPPGPSSPCSPSSTAPSPWCCGRARRGVRARTDRRRTDRASASSDRGRRSSPSPPLRRRRIPGSTRHRIPARPWWRSRWRRSRGTVAHARGAARVGPRAPDSLAGLAASCRSPGCALRAGRRVVISTDAGWSSPVARRAHNPKVAGSNPAPATNWKARKHWVSGPSALSGLLASTGSIYRLGSTSCPVSRAYAVALPVDDLPAVDWSGGRDEVGEAGRGVGAHAREEVLVGGHGEPRVGMTEALAHNLDRSTGGDEQAGVGVAKVVESDAGKPAAGDDAGRRAG